MKSLIFSGDMVRAILDGRKTMTRRVINNVEKYIDGIHVTPEYLPDFKEWCFVNEKGGYPDSFKSRYLPGETVYVKETRGIYSGGEDGDLIPGTIPGARIVYKATDDMGDLKGWKSPRFMPEWASRQKLKILTVKAERLQDITEEDAVREGIEPPSCFICGYTYLDCLIQMDHKLCGNGTPERAKNVFKNLWNTLYAKKPDLQWAQNPWNFAYGFERSE